MFKRMSLSWCCYDRNSCLHEQICCKDAKNGKEFPSDSSSHFVWMYSERFPLPEDPAMARWAEEERLRRTTGNKMNRKSCQHLSLSLSLSREQAVNEGGKAVTDGCIVTFFSACPLISWSRNVVLMTKPKSKHKQQHMRHIWGSYWSYILRFGNKGLPFLSVPMMYAHVVAAFARNLISLSPLLCLHDWEELK